MARTGKLSSMAVAKAKGPGVLHDGGGLYLRVSSAGTRSWVFRYQVSGRRHDMGLGPYPDVSLADARNKALAFRKVASDGLDVLEQRTRERERQRADIAKGRKFRDVAEEFIARHEIGWRNPKHRQQWRQTLSQYVYPALGELPVSAVDAGLVIKVLDPIWLTKPETASRLRGRIEAVLDSAIAQGYREGANPAQWKNGLSHVLPARTRVRRVKHHSALPFEELPGFMRLLAEQSGVSARALEFTIFTAARTSETLNATWREIDLAGKTWAIPGARMKSGRDHLVPLSEAALSVIRSVRARSERSDGKVDSSTPVFPGSRRAFPLSGMAMLMTLRRMGHGGEITAHGFRASFKSWASERTAFPREVVEMALAHAIGNPTEAAYQRGTLLEKRRTLMNAWAKFCRSR